MWDGGVRSTMRRRALVQVVEKISAVLDVISSGRWDFGAVRRRYGLRPRRSGPRRFDAGRRAVRKLRGRTDSTAQTATLAGQAPTPAASEWEAKLISTCLA